MLCERYTRCCISKPATALFVVRMLHLTTFVEGKLDKVACCRDGQEKSTAYRKDELWLFSNVPDFNTAAAAASMQQPWVAVACSKWHGPNKDGK